MDEKTKLYVFEKKEMALIFIFMILIALTSFILGVRLGKNYSFEMAGFKTSDREAIELLSTKEELMKETTKEQEIKKTEELISREQIEKELEKKLQEEMERQASLNSNGNATKIPNKKTSNRETNEDTRLPTQEIVEDNEMGSVPDPNIARRGKFTIQLGSYRTLDEASRFANGFTVRGYSPIVYQAEIEGRGIWYRVSLGEFLTRDEAREYIVQESSLFQGQTPLINVFE